MGKQEDTRRKYFNVYITLLFMSIATLINILVFETYTGKSLLRREVFFGISIIISAIAILFVSLYAVQINKNRKEKGKPYLLSGKYRNITTNSRLVYISIIGLFVATGIILIAVGGALVFF